MTIIDAAWHGFPKIGRSSSGLEAGRLELYAVKKNDCFNSQHCYFVRASGAARCELLTTTLWLRISSVVALLFAVGHTLGGLKYWSPMGDNPVLQAMRATRFDSMGANRSYFDFYMGFGHSLSVAQVMQAVLLWQLSTLALTNAQAVRPMIAVFVLATLASGIIAWRFIFPVPALFSAVLVASLTVAFVLAR